MTTLQKQNHLLKLKLTNAVKALNIANMELISIVKMFQERNVKVDAALKNLHKKKPTLTLVKG